MIKINLKPYFYHPKLKIKDLKLVMDEISKQLQLHCHVYFPVENTVDKVRGWTTQLDKVLKEDRAVRDGMIICLKKEAESLVKIKVEGPFVGPKGVSAENASDHAKVEALISLIFSAPNNLPKDNSSCIEK